MMLEIGGFRLGIIFQGVTIALITALGIWIKYGPDRTRAENESIGLKAKIEEDLRSEAAVRFQEFRDEVHSLRNELGAARAELHQTTAKSVRRGDKLNMVLFILRLVMDELHAKEPANKVLAQARSLLSRVEDEPHVEGNSDALNQAEDTVEAAQATVREVKAEEAKKEGDK